MDVTDASPESLARVADLAVRHIRKRRFATVAPVFGTNALAGRLVAYDFGTARDGVEVAADLLDLLGTNAVCSDHPACFGLFNRRRSPP